MEQITGELSEVELINLMIIDMQPQLEINRMFMDNNWCAEEIVSNKMHFYENGEISNMDEIIYALASITADVDDDIDELFDDVADIDELFDDTCPACGASDWIGYCNTCGFGH